MMAAETILVKPLDTAPFHAIPPAPRHAITTHMPGWDLGIEFTKRKPEFLMKFVDFYPRFIIHRDIKQVRDLLFACKIPSS